MTHWLKHRPWLGWAMVGALGCSGTIGDGGGASATGAARPGAERASAAGGTAVGARTAAPGATTAGAGPTATLDPTRPVQSLPSPARLWLLSATQYGRTVATLFAGRSQQGNVDLTPPGGMILPLGDMAPPLKFSTLAAQRRLTEDRIDGVFSAADDLSTRLLAHASVAPCVNGTGPLRDCLGAIVAQKGELLFRRPLAADDVARYVEPAAALEPQVGRAEAARTTLRALLVAPQFLLRSEIGTGAGTSRLEAFEIASALSYALTDGPPDQALWDDAVHGALDTAAIGRHVARLLTAPERSVAVQTFVRELFQYDDTINIARSEKFYHPNDLVQQADLFLDGVLKANGHRDLWRALMTSRAGFISTSTAQNYNAKAPTMTNPPSTPQPYTFDGERQGVLGLPAWLSTYAQPDRTDPVVRGRFVQERLLCNTLPNAPVEGVAPLSTDVKVPLRRRFAAHTANPTCRACHGMMDDLGLAFEGFDEYGRARDVEAGVPVDRSGVLRGSGDQDGAFTGLDGLAARLVASAGARNCFVANAFESFMGRAPGDGDTAALAEARRQLDASGDLTPLLQAFFTAQGFVARTRAH